MSEKPKEPQPPQGQLFETPSEPEPQTKRPDLDLDYFTPGKKPELAQTTFRDKIPAEVQRQLSQRQAEFNRRFDQLDHAGMPEGVKQEILRREFPDLMSPEEVEKSEVEAIKKGVGPSTRPKKDRRHLGPNQQNVADGDKRVEDYYQGMSNRLTRDALRRQTDRIDQEGL